MISEDSKNAIDALPRDELRIEVSKGRRSRFQGDKFDYVQARLQQLEENDAVAQHEAELGLAVEANKLSKEANKIAEESNKTSKNAWRASILSVVVAVVAIVVSMCTQR